MADVLVTGARSRWAEEGGFGVIVAVIVGFVVLTGGITMLTLSLDQSEDSAQERDRERAFAAAEAGVNAAINLMTVDPSNCPGLDGRPVLAGTLPGGGEYEVTFTAPEPRFACTTPANVDRYIVARGWAPTKDAPQGQRRQVEQQIKLKPLDGFDYALFAAPGGITAGQRVRINGDLYADHDLVLEQHTDVFGDLYGHQSVRLRNNTTVAGDLWTLGDSFQEGANSLVQGDVKSSGGPKRDTAGNPVAGTWAGNITNTGTIDKKAIAPGAITGTGTFRGGKVSSPISPPPRRSLPTFDPAAVTYDTTYTSDASFESARDGSSSPALAGSFRVTGTGTVDLDRKPKISLAGGETTMVVANGPIRVTSDISSTTSTPTTLILVSLASSTPTTTPSILLSQQQTLPANVTIVLFAPNGCVKFENQKSFAGVVYARCLDVSNQFTLDYRDPGTVPGVNWTASSATHFAIEAYTFREVAFQP